MRPPSRKLIRSLFITGTVLTGLLAGEYLWLMGPRDANFWMLSCLSVTLLLLGSKRESRLVQAISKRAFLIVFIVLIGCTAALFPMNAAGGEPAWTLIAAWLIAIGAFLVTRFAPR